MRKETTCKWEASGESNTTEKKREEGKCLKKKLVHFSDIRACVQGSCRIYKFPRVVISYNDFYIDIWKHISLKIYKSMLCSIVYNLFPECLIFIICLQLDTV